MALEMAPSFVIFLWSLGHLLASKSPPFSRVDRTIITIYGHPLWLLHRWLRVATLLNVFHFWHMVLISHSPCHHPTHAGKDINLSNFKYLTFNSFLLYFTSHYYCVCVLLVDSTLTINLHLILSSTFNLFITKIKPNICPYAN